MNSENGSNDAQPEQSTDGTSGGSAQPSQAPAAVVTGGNTGIGRATAIQLARQGMDVAITWQRDEPAARETVAEIESYGRVGHMEEMDLTGLPEAAEVIDRLAERLGRIDVLVNNAGLGSSTLYVDTPYSEVRKLLDINLTGPFLCGQRAALRMIDQGNGGRIINVTSVHEHEPRVGAAPYCAAKGGMGALTQVLALELAEHGILVNAVAPGAIATDISGAGGKNVAGERRPGIPLARSGDPVEVARVIGFLASSDSSYVTGASWLVDGGMLRMGPQAGSHLFSDDWRRP